MSPPDKWIGREINRYRIIERLGSGALGNTFKALHIPDEEVVALKILRSDLGDLEPEAQKRFKREIAILHRVKHPNILWLKDHGYYRGNKPYLVTEFKSGGNLRQYLDRHKGGLQIEEVLKIFQPIADAVDFAHREGVVHRDLKPENVVLQISDGIIYPYLTDFGIATVRDGTVYTMTSAEFLGTYKYMAPEMWRKGEEKTERVDIYAMGIMLYEALEGKLPFDGNQHELMYSHIHDTVPYPHETERRTNRQVVKVLQKALAKYPKKRFQSACELIEELRNAYDTGKAKDRKERQNKLKIIIAAIALIVPLIAAVIQSNWFSGLFIVPILSTETPTMTATHLSPTTTSSITPTTTLTLTFTPSPSPTLEDTRTPTYTPTNTPRVIISTATGTRPHYPSGDANHDCIVDDSDYDIWLAHYGESTTRGYRDGDFNGDGTVNGQDYNSWRLHYGDTC